MSFSSSPFSASAFSDLGAVVSVDVTVDLSAVSLLGTLVLNNSGIGAVSNANFDATSISFLINGTVDASNLTFVGDANVDLSSTTILGTLALSIDDVIGNANIDITSVSFPTTLFFNPPTSFVGNANITLISSTYDNATYDSNVYNAELNATFDIQTQVSFIPSLSASLIFNTGDVIGNANVNVNTSFNIVSTIPTLNPDAIITFSAEDYSKDRTVYVDFKDNFIKNVIEIPEQSRIVYVRRKDSATSIIKIPEQNRIVYIAEKQHISQSKMLRAA